MEPLQRRHQDERLQLSLFTLNDNFRAGGHDGKQAIGVDGTKGEQSAYHLWEGCGRLDLPAAAAHNVANVRAIMLVSSAEDKGVASSSALRV